MEHNIMDNIRCRLLSARIDVMHKIATWILKHSDKLIRKRHNLWWPEDPI